MPRGYAVDASFLAGEVDPAVVARLDDVVRANAAGRIRNGYVRSMGGVRVRPGMRVAQSIEGRQLDRAEGLEAVVVEARVNPGGGADATMIAVDLSTAPAIIPPFSRDAGQVFRIRFRDADGEVTLPRGTTITVRIRQSANTPEGLLTRLYWWEWARERDPFTGSTTPGDPSFVSDGVVGGTGAGNPADSNAGGRWAVGRWRSGAGLDPQRNEWDDLLPLQQVVYQDFSHTLVQDASRVALWRRGWRRTDSTERPGLQPPFGWSYNLEVESWGGEYARQTGAGARPVSRLLNATWFPGADLLLALHGSQATLLRGTDPERLEMNPFGFVPPEPRFTNEQVSTMQANPSPDGVYLHSPGTGTGFRGAVYPPRRLFFDARESRLTIEEVQLAPPGPIQRSGQSIDAIGPFYPPSIVFPHQGRLIMAGTQIGPNAIWFSEAGNRNNFRAPAVTEARPLLASDPFMVEEAGRPNNHLLAAHGGLLTVFFGSRGISFLDRPFISATEFGFRENAERGIKAGVPPVEIGTGRLVFVDASGQSVWLMTYANERQGYILTELSQQAPHLLHQPEDNIFYTGLPDGATAVLIVNENGTIACCAIQPEGEWHAWSEWDSDDILDVEPYAGGVWAMTRRGDGFRSTYIEVFDDAVELDFCHVSEDGSHPFSDEFTHWSAVAEMRDGTRVRFGMRPSADVDAGGRERGQPGFQETDDQRFTAIEVFNGLRSFGGDWRPDEEQDFDPNDVVRWQVGQPFTWEVATMPFVKRSAEGSTFTSPTKTQELFVNCIIRSDQDVTDELLERLLGAQSTAAYTVNGEYIDPSPRLFAEPRPTRVGPREVGIQHRFVNLIGWMSQNKISLKGQAHCIIGSVSRTVVT